MSTPKRLCFVLVLVPTVLAPMGCGDVAGPDQTLTDAETAALVQGLYGGRLLVHREIFHIGPYASFKVSMGRSPVRAEIPCARGGRALFAGDVMLTLADGVLSGALEGTLTASDCAFSAADVPFLMDSDNLAQTIRITLSNDTGIQIEADVSGTLTWAVGNRRGRCDVASKLESRISFEDAAAEIAPPAQVSGTVCGRAIEHEITLAVSP